MGWFSKSKNEDLGLPWQKAENKEVLDQLLASAETQPVLFFKHSSRCNISAMALSRFAAKWDVNEPCTLAFIDVIQNRDVSMYLAEKINVFHQSPQAIVIDNGLVIYDASHGGIDASEILKKLRK